MQAFHFPSVTFVAHPLLRHIADMKELKEFREVNVFKKIFLVGVLGLATLAFSTPASAVAKLMLDDGGTTVTIVDNGVGDISPILGVVSFNGSVGTNWVVNVTTGISAPIIGDPPPNMDLNSVNVSSSGAGTLTIKFTDDGFYAVNGKFNTYAGPTVAYTLVGGTTDGSVALTTYAGIGAFGAPGISFANTGALGPGAFSSSSSAPLLAWGANDYLTIEAVIIHTAAGQISSFDGELTVPEPTTLSILGIGLAAFGLVNRRRRG